MNNKSPQLGQIRDYILKHFPETLWWDGYNKHEQFNPIRAYKHRQGLPNEIRIEFDYENKEENWNAVYETCFNLTDSEYSYAVYETEGGRGPHIHIYDLDELETIEDISERELYRKQFLKKICGKYKADEGLCDEKHLCALEFANHFKYNKPKKLIAFIDNGNNQGIELDIKLDIIHKKITNKNSFAIKKYSNHSTNSTDPIRNLIINNCCFEKVFEKYKINYKGTMALCPFHADSNRSLSFSNEKGLWKCFGCNTKGDIITLIKMLREMNGNKKRS